VLFKRFLQDARNAAAAKYTASDRDGPLSRKARAQRLRAIQAVIAPITVAAQCATNGAEIEQLRAALGDILHALDEIASRLENY
jgi:hypothetical protein